jgi:hypothetical protein
VVSTNPTSPRTPDSPDNPVTPDSPVTPDFPDTPDTDDAIVLTQDGLGELYLGSRDALSLSITDVETWLDEALSPKNQTGECSLATNEDLGIALVTDPYGGVMGFVIDNQQVTTPEGIRVGSTAEDLEAAYGDSLEIVEGALSNSGGPLALVDDTESPGAAPDATSRHLAVDTDPAGTVTRLKAGYWPWMGYPDYCEVESPSPQDTGWPLTGA